MTAEHFGDLPASLYQIRDLHFEEAHRAVVAMTARAELAERFAASKLTVEELAERVGHSERIARRVIEGKESLNETKVAAYFRAMA